MRLFIFRNLYQSTYVIFCLFEFGMIYEHKQDFSIFKLNFMLSNYTKYRHHHDKCKETQVFFVKLLHDTQTDNIRLEKAV